MHGLAVAKVLAFKYIDFLQGEPNQASGPAIEREFTNYPKPSFPTNPVAIKESSMNGRLNTCNSAGAASRPERQSPHHNIRHEKDNIYH